MSLSSRAFLAGLDLTAQRPAAQGGEITTARFGAAFAPSDQPAEIIPLIFPRASLSENDALGSTDQIRPMVFMPFGGQGEAAVREQAVETADLLDEVEEIEAEEPPPPPPDFEAIKAAAWTEGFQQGYDEGLRLAAEEQRDTATRLGALLHDVAADTEAFVRGLEHEVVELALEIAEKVIARETKTDPRIVVDVVRSALNEIHDATDLRIRAHPDDIELLAPRWQEMLPRRVAERSELVPDDLVERGGVVVETQIGYVDGQLKTRINQVVNTFQAVLDGEPV